MVGAMPKVSQQYRDARRDQILNAARRCFLRDGFHATSMQDLFAEAGLSSGAVYRYFASKDDVIIAIAEDNMRGVVEMIRDVAAQQPSQPAGAVLADVLDVVQARDARNGLGKLALLVWAEALRSPSIAGRFKTMLTQMRAAFAEIVREHQSPGDVSADAMAAALFSVLPGYILQLALLGPEAVAGVPDAVRALWPS
jgi:TetR/AcrR family transcriptional regulator, transcriptional repressor of aconitase